MLLPRRRRGGRIDDQACRPGEQRGASPCSPGLSDFPAYLILRDPLCGQPSIRHKNSENNKKMLVKYYTHIYYTLVDVTEV